MSQTKPRMAPQAVPSSHNSTSISYRWAGLDLTQWAEGRLRAEWGFSPVGTRKWELNNRPEGLNTGDWGSSAGSAGVALSAV